MVAIVSTKAFEMELVVAAAVATVCLRIFLPFELSLRIVLVLHLSTFSSSQPFLQDTFPLLVKASEINQTVFILSRKFAQLHSATIGQGKHYFFAKHHLALQFCLTSHDLMEY